MNQVEMEIIQKKNQLELELLSGVGTNDYMLLKNKPRINGIELLDQNFEDLGLLDLSNEDIENILG